MEDEKILLKKANKFITLSKSHEKCKKEHPE